MVCRIVLCTTIGFLTFACLDSQMSDAQILGVFRCQMLTFSDVRFSDVRFSVEVRRFVLHRDPDSQIPKFLFPTSQIPKFPNSQIPKFSNAQLPKRSTPKLSDSHFPRRSDSQMCSCSSSQILRFCWTDSQILMFGCSESQIVIWLPIGFGSSPQPPKFCAHAR